MLLPGLLLNISERVDITMLKLQEKVPKIVYHAIDNARYAAMMDIFKNRKPIAVLPMHTSNMQIEYLSSGKAEIKPTIIPPLNIFVDPHGIVNNTILRQYLSYRIQYNNNPVPLSHVFNGSGHLCLGDIFVPEAIPYHSPQQPLETLFLANDRNMAHGDPILYVSNETKNKIAEILVRCKGQSAELNTYIDDLITLLQNEKNWCEHDVLWQIGNVLLSIFKHDKNQAFKTANDIYSLIFARKR